MSYKEKFINIFNIFKLCIGNDSLPENKENFTGLVESGSTKSWFKDGILHREDGPAYIDEKGTEQWFLNGKKHRVNGPAVIKGKNKEWYVNGLLHREDGPAIIHYNHFDRQYDELWYLNGYQLTKKEVNNYLLSKELNQELNEKPIYKAKKKLKI